MPSPNSVIMLSAKTETSVTHVSIRVNVSAPRMASPPTSKGVSAAIRPRNTTSMRMKSTGMARTSARAASADTCILTSASTPVAPPTWVRSPRAASLPRIRSSCLVLPGSLSATAT